MNLPSKVVEQAVDEFAALPSIGKRSALRFVLHLLKQDPNDLEDLAQAILKLKNDIIYCKSCYNISNQEVCDICSNPERDSQTLCIVEDVRDIMAIENTYQYKGLYHVLGGIISPMDGIGPTDLKIEELVKRVEQENITEIIFALSPTMEGDTTNFYIYKKIKDLNFKITTLSRGVSVGSELQYADELTLSRSLQNRLPFTV